jgi:hypothetical protein
LFYFCQLLAQIAVLYEINKVTLLFLKLKRNSFRVLSQRKKFQSLRTQQSRSKEIIIKDNINKEKRGRKIAENKARLIQWQFTYIT